MRFKACTLSVPVCLVILFIGLGSSGQVAAGVSLQLWGTDILPLSDYQAVFSRGVNGEYRWRLAPGSSYVELSSGSSQLNLTLEGATETETHWFQLGQNSTSELPYELMIDWSEEWPVEWLSLPFTRNLESADWQLISGAHCERSTVSKNTLECQLRPELGRKFRLITRYPLLLPKGLSVVGNRARPSEEMDSEHDQDRPDDKTPEDGVFLIQSAFIGVVPEIEGFRAGLLSKKSFKGIISGLLISGEDFLTPLLPADFLVRNLFKYPSLEGSHHIFLYHFSSSRERNKRERMNRRRQENDGSEPPSEGSSSEDETEEEETQTGASSELLSGLFSLRDRRGPENWPHFQSQGGVMVGGGATATGQATAPVGGSSTPPNVLSHGEAKSIYEGLPAFMKTIYRRSNSQGRWAILLKYRTPPLDV